VLILGSKRLCNGVEGSLRSGAKFIFLPPPTKTAQFEGKNRRKSAEEAKAEYFCCSVIYSK